MKNPYNQNNKDVSTRKVSMNLPVDLVENAADYLGKPSLTEAVRDALREAMHRQACTDLLAARGTFDPKIDLAALRNDD